MTIEELAKICEEEVHDELTSLMHAEFLEGEVTPLQMRCLDASVRIDKGESKADALRANGLTEKEYDDNIMEALRSI